MKIFRRMVMPVLLLALLAASGCVKLWQESLDVKTYMIEARREGAALKSPPADKLWIDTVAVLPPYNVRSLIVRTSDVEYEASYYTELLLSPADNIRNNLFMWFSSAGIFEQGSVADRKNISHRLVVTVLKLHGSREAEAQHAVVALKVTLFDERADGMNILFSRTYEQREPVADVEAAELIRAYNRALAAILASCEADVVGALKPAGQM